MEKDKNGKGKEAKREEVLSFRADWKGSKQIEMIEGVLCAKIYIVIREEDCRT